MRLLPALPLLAALLACASAAPAQSSPASPPVTEHVGSPLTYRIGFPRGWEVERNDVDISQQAQMQGGTATNTVQLQFQGESVSATSGTGYIHLLVTDMVPVKRSDLPVSWAEQRRIVTSTILSSDSLLFGLLANAARGLGPNFQGAAREIRTLGGQRAGYLNGVLVQPGLQSRTEFYVTVKDGIVYVMIFAERDSRFAAREPLFARVRDSLVFAENAPVSPPE